MSKVLASEVVALRELVAKLRRALPDRPPGHLDHAWNEKHDIGRMNYTMNVTRGHLNAAYEALEKFELRQYSLAVKEPPPNERPRGGRRRR